jgi:hypothetical protein
VRAQSLRVLVVEDRAEDAELTIRELRRAKLNCETKRVDKADAPTSRSHFARQPSSGRCVAFCR